eukprot:15461449-Alexandrium_andersonii.AAC.1
MRVVPEPLSPGDGALGRPADGAPDPPPCAARACLVGRSSARGRPWGALVTTAALRTWRAGAAGPGLVRGSAGLGM